MDIYSFGKPEAKIVLIQPVDGHDLSDIKKEVSVIASFCDMDFHLIAVRIDDWNDELSPWESPPVFGKKGFGDGAEKTLKKILELCFDKNKTYYIGGYSLSGLFALWSAYQTDVFKGVAAASPSIWFPGFIEYMKKNDIKTNRVYLSLGDKEEKTKNPIMATVGDRIREGYELLEERGVDCTLEWNDGNHFKDPDIRTAKSFIWIMNNQKN